MINFKKNSHIQYNRTFMIYNSFDTGLFHIKRESFVTIEAKVISTIQESKSICLKKIMSMNFYEMVSWDSANCLDHGISLRY